jgi:hypothetical protein
MPRTRERANALPYSAEANAAPTVVFTKPKGYTRFRVRLSAALETGIATGKVIEVNCIIGVPGEAGEETSLFYRQARVLTEDFTFGWHDLQFLFKGMPLYECVIPIIIERRSDSSTHGTPSESNLYIRRTSGISEL